MSFQRPLLHQSMKLLQKIEKRLI